MILHYDAGITLRCLLRLTFYRGFLRRYSSVKTPFQALHTRLTMETCEKSEIDSHGQSASAHGIANGRWRGLILKDPTSRQVLDRNESLILTASQLYCFSSCAGGSANP